MRPGVTLDFFLALMEGVHQPGDTYMMALYVQDTPLNEGTAAYQTAGEVRAPGYMPGGKALTGRQVQLAGSVVGLTWDSPIWEKSSISARAALIYNLSKKNRSVAVLDLGKVVTSTNGDFRVELPTINEPLVQIGLSQESM